jgi:hypothetical protein
LTGTPVFPHLGLVLSTAVLGADASPVVGPVHRGVELHHRFSLLACDHARTASNPLLGEGMDDIADVDRLHRRFTHPYLVPPECRSSTAMYVLIFTLSSCPRLARLVFVGIGAHA